MPTPAKGYFLKDGTKVPGVTTILGRYKESGGLIRWAYGRGKEGVELYESRDKAAQIGSIVHNMVERWVSGNDPEFGEFLSLSDADKEAASSSFGAFREWFDSNRFRILCQEVQMVSEAHRFGGTPDSVADDSKGRVVLLDWKSSDATYTDNLLQLGGYRILWNENHPENPLTGGSHLCRFSKQHGDFEHRYFPSLDEAERCFLLLREAYSIDQVLKKRIK